LAIRILNCKILHADGTPWPDAEVHFNLQYAFETAGEVHPADTITKITEEDGSCSVNLAVPDEGTVPYKVFLPDNVGQSINLGPGPETDLQTVLVLAPVAVDQNAVQVAIDAANLATIRTVTQATAIVAGDQIIRANGTFAVTLPAATGSGRAYLIKNIGNGTVTVTRAGSDLIDGGATVALPPLDRCSVLDAAPGWWDEL
jgi:hypothetical protein